MKLIAGVFLLVLAAVVGTVEVAAIIHSQLAHQVATAFAVHDPFSPRGPLELHVFSIILFITFLVSGIALVRRRGLHGRSTI